MAKKKGAVRQKRTAGRKRATVKAKLAGRRHAKGGPFNPPPFAGKPPRKRKK